MARYRRNGWHGIAEISSQTNELDSIPANRQRYKTEILELFDEAIRTEDSNKLQFCIATCWRDGIDSDYFVRFEKVILARWHEQHEDIVDLVYQLKDERFCDALYEISFNPGTYRRFDDEDESTLRKCVHALKVMKSEKAERILKRLVDAGNPNVKYALEAYG